MKPLKSYKFGVNYEFGYCQYTIKHTDKPEKELTDAEYIDNEFLRQINIRFSEINVSKWLRGVLILFCIMFQVVMAIVFSNDIITQAWLQAFCTVFIIMSLLVGLVCLAFVFQDSSEDAYFKNIELLYELTPNGILQRNIAKNNYYIKEKENRDKKAEKLVNIYDTLDCINKNKDEKIEIISNILEKGE